MKYDRIGVGYRLHRQPDPRVAAQINAALGNAKSVVNVGAGAGSYEPAGLLRVIAVEPSEIMIAQRSPTAAPCLRAVAEALPFRDGCFDAAMGVLTIHHWANAARGLEEMRRAARDRVVILTWDPDCDENFWLTRDYVPEILAMDRARFPSLETIANALGGNVKIETLAIPRDCIDGFRGAFWERPHAYLDPQIRQSMSAFQELDTGIVNGAMKCLAADLASGDWHHKNSGIASQPWADIGYRIVIAT